MHASNTGHKELPLEGHYSLHDLGPQFGLSVVGYKSEENVRERYYNYKEMETHSCWRT
jgi:hypothetical protein